VPSFESIARRNKKKKNPNKLGVFPWNNNKLLLLQQRDSVPAVLSRLMDGRLGVYIMRMDEKKKRGNHLRKRGEM
jgi:hypothetical protein